MLADFWAFLRDPDNRATIAMLGAGAAVVAGGMWKVLARRSHVRASKVDHDFDVSLGGEGGRAPGSGGGGGGTAVCIAPTRESNCTVGLPLLVAGGGGGTGPGVHYGGGGGGGGGGGTAGAKGGGCGCDLTGESSPETNARQAGLFAAFMLLTTCAMRAARKRFGK